MIVHGFVCALRDAGAAVPHPRNTQRPKYVPTHVVIPIHPCVTQTLTPACMRIRTYPCVQAVLEKAKRLLREDLDFGGGPSSGPGYSGYNGGAGGPPGQGGSGGGSGMGALETLGMTEASIKKLHIGGTQGLGGGKRGAGGPGEEYGGIPQVRGMGRKEGLRSQL